MAEDLEATAGGGHSRGQATSATADAAARHPGRGKRRFRIATRDSRHGLPIAPNLLDRNFTAARPNQAWVGDITYIPTDEGWLFLAVVLDLFNRQVVGWSLAEDLGCELVIDAFEMAWYRRCRGRRTELIFHSDRGSQYASEPFRELLRSAALRLR